MCRLGRSTGGKSPGTDSTWTMGRMGIQSDSSVTVLKCREMQSLIPKLKYILEIQVDNIFWHFQNKVISGMHHELRQNRWQKKSDKKENIRREHCFLNAVLFQTNFPLIFFFHFYTDETSSTKCSVQAHSLAHSKYLSFAKLTFCWNCFNFRPQLQVRTSMSLMMHGKRRSWKKQQGLRWKIT